MREDPVALPTELTQQLIAFDIRIIFVLHTKVHTLHIIYLLGDSGDF